jgi:hypothetical protein
MLAFFLFSMGEFEDVFEYATILLAALSVAGFLTRCSEVRLKTMTGSVWKRRIMLATAAILLPLMVITYAVWSGMKAAQIVENGDVLEEVTGYGGFLGVETREVRRFEALQAGFKEFECSDDREEGECHLIYLGVNQGICYLYDPVGFTVLRIPVPLARIDTL